MQAIHLLTGVAQGGMPHVMQQGSAVDQPAVLGQIRLQALQMGQGPAGQVKHADRVGEPA